MTEATSEDWGKVTYITVITEESAAQKLNLPVDALRAWAKVNIVPLRVLTDHGPMYALRDVDAFRVWLYSYRRLQYVAYAPQCAYITDGENDPSLPVGSAEMLLFAEGDPLVAAQHDDALAYRDEELAQLYGGLNRAPKSVAHTQPDLAWYHWSTIVNRVPVIRVATPEEKRRRKSNLLASKEVAKPVRAPAATRSSTGRSSIARLKKRRSLRAAKKQVNEKPNPSEVW